MIELVGSGEEGKHKKILRARRERGDIVSSFFFPGKCCLLRKSKFGIGICCHKTH